MPEPQKSEGLHSSPKIFLYGYYGFGNVGDDLLLSGVVSALTQNAPNARFVVRSLYPVEGFAADRIQFLGLERIISNAEWSRRRRLWHYALSTWGSLRGCSHLVFGGGTLFHAHGGSSINLALIAMIMLMARLRGAHVYVLGVGVARIHGWLPRGLMGLALSMAHDFAVRDSSSYENCCGLIGASKVRCTADLVFILPLKKIDVAVPLPKRWVLGLTLAASDIAQDHAAHGAFFDSLAKAAERLLAVGWEIRFLSFQELDLDGAKLSDSALFSKVLLRARTSEVRMVRVSSNVGELTDQFADIDIVVGMRFHGHVIAAMLEIPFVGFGRDHKVSDLCTLFSMPFIPMNDLTIDNLIEAVENAKNRIPDQIKVREQIKSAEMNFGYVGASLK